MQRDDAEDALANCTDTFALPALNTSEEAHMRAKPETVLAA